MKRKRGPITRQHIRHYLMPCRNRPNVKRKILAALKRYFRDYLEQPDLVKSFKFPSSQYRPKHITNKATLQAFFPHLPCEEAKLIFLFYATSGLRRSEALQLDITDIDMENQMVIPNHRDSQTKHTYLTFYNDECRKYMDNYLDQRDETDARLFQFSDRTVNRWFEITKHESGIYLSPQRLREFFCSEMLRLGVQECYVDSFCGRVPKSILARHYVNYSPNRLQEVYRNTNLQVLTE
jgi:integrase